MPTLTSVNAQWTNTLAVGDADLRRINAGSLVGDGTALGARGGIVYHGPSSLAVTVNGSDQIIVQPGVVAIPSSVALAGVYMAAFGTTTGPSAGTAVATRNSTNPRIDLVVADIASGVARIRTVEGTPSSSPAAPALPTGAVEISRLNVPQVGGGAVTVDSTWRQYATALGGIMTVETAARLPTSGVLKSQRAIALDTGQGYVWDSVTSTWRRDINPGQYTEVGVTILPESGAFSNANATCRYAVIGRTFFGEFVANVITAGTATNAIRLGMPPGLLARTGGPVGKGSGVEVGSTNWLVSARLSDASTISVYKYDGTTVIATGRRVDLNVVLELA